MKKFLRIVASLLLGANAFAQDQVDFRVDLPDSWRLVSFSAEEKLWAYESNNGHHRLTVSVLYYSEEPTHTQQRAFLEDFIRTRQEQVSLITGNVQFEPTEFNEYRAAWVAKFSELSNKGRVATTKAISSRIGIANFYLESVSGLEDHEQVREIILSTTGFAS